MILLLAATFCEVTADWTIRRERPLAEDVALELRTDRHTYVVGEPVEFELSARNTSDATLETHLMIDPVSPFLDVHVRLKDSDSRLVELSRGDRRRTHLGITLQRKLAPNETVAEKGSFTIDWRRDRFILNTPGTYHFTATYCDRPGDLNTVLESTSWLIEVEPPPDRHRDAFEAYSKDLARVSAWPVPEEPSGELVDQAFDFVERFSDSPWAKPLRRMLVAKMSNRLARKEATPLQQERFERLLQSESLRETGSAPGSPPSP